MRARIQLLALAVIAVCGLSLSTPAAAEEEPIKEELYCCWDTWNANGCCYASGCRITSSGCEKV